MIARNVVFSAQVTLRLNVGNQSYELGQIGPDFALLRKAQAIDAIECEIESIIDSVSTRRPVMLTSPITGSSRRFTFETP